MTGFAALLLTTALPFALLATIVTSLAYVLGRRRVDAAPGYARRVAIRGLLGTYVCALAWWTIALSNPSHEGVRHANLMPFREIARSLTDGDANYALLNFWGNVVAFLPVGVLAVLAMRRGGRRAWFIALAGGTALSSSLELAQYTVGRSADVDDVILNAVGVALGAALAAVTRPARTATSRESRDQVASPPQGEE